MLFNSYGFIFLFLPVVLPGFFQLARVSHAFAAGWLAAASLFFYGYWNLSYVGLLLGSVVCNYAFGMWIAKAGVKQDALRQKRLLVLALAANLLLLAYYKYANFFLGSINSVADYPDFLRERDEYLQRHPEFGADMQKIYLSK